MKTEDILLREKENCLEMLFYSFPSNRNIGKELDFVLGFLEACSLTETKKDFLNLLTDGFDPGKISTVGGYWSLGDREIFIECSEFEEQFESIEHARSELGTTFEDWTFNEPEEKPCYGYYYIGSGFALDFTKEELQTFCQEQLERVLEDLEEEEKEEKMQTILEDIPDLNSCILSDSHGIYIPKLFVESLESYEKSYLLRETSLEEWHFQQLEDAENEFYWDSWNSFLDEYRTEDGQTIYQNGSLYFIDNNKLSLLPEEIQEFFWENWMQ